MVEKIVGAAAEQGMDLKCCAQLGFEVNARTNSIGAALTSCTVPAAGTPTFSLGPEEMEMGVGIHREPGCKRVHLASADAIADDMVSAILTSLDRPEAGEVLLFVNGFGGTPALELYLMYNSGAARPGETRAHGCPFARRFLRHLARNGRMLDNGHAARCQAERSLGCSRPYRCT